MPLLLCFCSSWTLQFALPKLQASAHSARPSASAVLFQLFMQKLLQQCHLATESNYDTAAAAEMCSFHDACRLDDTADSMLGDDVAFSEDADELYPEGTESNVLGSFDQEESPDSADAAEEDSELDADPLVAGDSDSKGEQNSLIAEEAQPDEEEDSSVVDEADMDSEQDGEPEQDAFLIEEDAATDPEDQDISNEGKT